MNTNTNKDKVKKFLETYYELRKNYIESVKDTIKERIKEKRISDEFNRLYSMFETQLDKDHLLLAQKLN